ncbi:hypothetical protein GC176_18005 [bacterium]|nr:hypothetical protein [bacterium]
MTRPTMTAAFLLCLLTASLTLLGCGSQAYEERLAASTAYFSYRQQVDNLLESRTWTSEGITFRPPKGFAELPPPPPAPDENSPPPPDKRQPAFLTSKLPGLVGAWQAQMRVEIPDSDVEELPAWILICTNHDDYRQKFDNPTVIPADFMDHVIKALADSSRVYQPSSAIEPWQFAEVRSPSGTAYVPRKDYDWILLSDPEMTYEVDRRKARYDFRLYRYFVGQNIQLALVTIVPSDDILARSARPYDGIDMAIEQMTATDEIPRAQAGGPAAVPSSGGGF